MREVGKMKDLPVKMLIVWVLGGPSNGLVGVMLGLSSHLKGILKRLKIKMQVKIGWYRGEGELPPPSKGPGTPPGEGI